MSPESLRHDQCTAVYRLNTEALSVSELDPGICGNSPSDTAIYYIAIPPIATLPTALESHGCMDCVAMATN
jgi:hypothetical protein